jgi:hypothetical protein
MLNFKLLHLIGLALYEEQNDLDKNFVNENATYTFKFLEKSISNSEKSLFSIKSFKTDETLLKTLSETIETVTTEPYKLLAVWILDYSQKLLKLKTKIDEQKQLTFASTTSFNTSGSGTGAVQDEARSSSSLSNEPQTSSQASMETEQMQKEKRKNLIAEKRRAKIMAQLNKQSNNFIESNKDFFDDIKTSSKPTSSHSDPTFSTLTSEEEA